MLQVPHVANNVRDLEARYAGNLDARLEMDEQRKPRLGACGDLLKQDLQDLERPVDLLVAGPPCPPWAGRGKKEGTADPRAWVYVQVLRFVVALVNCTTSAGPSQPASVPQGEGALCADQELDCEHAEELEGQSAP